MELLHKMENGGILTPSFNRGFVWKESDIKSLFESMHLGYPIGIILAFRGAFDHYTPSLPEFSHFPLKKADFSSSDSILWVIDGSQRLAAIYSVLRESSLGIELYFDLIKGEFLYDPKDKSDPVIINMSVLFDYNAFMDFQDRLLSSDEHRYLMSDVNNLHSRFQNYQVVMQVMTDTDGDDIANVFARINMSGHALSNDEVKKAKSYRSRYNSDQ
jgi:uncharacterized protein with ParB-like and HNH nuclease domain